MISRIDEKVIIFFVFFFCLKGSDCLWRSQPSELLYIRTPESNTFHSFTRPGSWPDSTSALLCVSSNLSGLFRIPKCQLNPLILTHTWIPARLSLHIHSWGRNCSCYSDSFKLEIQLTHSNTQFYFSSPRYCASFFCSGLQRPDISNPTGQRPAQTPAYMHTRLIARPSLTLALSAGVFLELQHVCGATPDAGVPPQTSSIPQAGCFFLGIHTQLLRVPSIHLFI